MNKVTERFRVVLIRVESIDAPIEVCNAETYDLCFQYLLNKTVNPYQLESIYRIEKYFIVEAE